MEGGTNNVQQGVKRVSNFDGKKANDVLELSPKIRLGLLYYNMSIVIIV